MVGTCLKRILLSIFTHIKCTYFLGAHVVNAKEWLANIFLNKNKIPFRKYQILNG
jgi:hypothetical protein